MKQQEVNCASPHQRVSSSGNSRGSLDWSWVPQSADVKHLGMDYLLISVDFENFRGNFRLKQWMIRFNTFCEVANLFCPKWIKTFTKFSDFD